MSGEIWYHGRLSRQKAEEMVKKAALDGSFVVRASESIQGAYALSVLCSGAIHTYRVLPTESGLLAVQTINGVQQRKFPSITDLIKAYRNPQNGLVCGLINPVGPGADKPVLNPPPPVATPIPTRSDSVGRFQQLQQDPPRPILPPPNTPAPQPPRMRVTQEDLRAQMQRELPPLPPPSREVPSQRNPLSPSFQAPVNPPVAPTRGVPSAVVPPPPAATKRDSWGNTSPGIVGPAVGRLTPPGGTLNTPASSVGNKSSVSAEIEQQLEERVKVIMNTCSAAGKGFMEQLYQYCQEGAKRDVDDVLNGSRQCSEMQKLLAKEAGQFQEELDLFLMKINVLRQLFDVHSTVTPPSPDLRAERDVDLESFLTRLGDCKDAVKNLDKRITITIKEQAGMEVESMYGTALRSSTAQSTQSIPEYSFEVKAEGGIKQSRVKLQVNVDLGRLVITKGDDVAQFKHDQVLQIVKNNKSRGKLSVLFDGGKKRDYIFGSSSQREAFCQVMQLVRNVHCDNTEPDSVSVFIGTWNMGDAMPPVDIRSWFRCNGTGRSLDPSICNIPHDIYVIGTQETGLPEKEWLHKVTETLVELTGTKFHAVAMDALWHIKIIILVKEEHRNRISHVQTSSVKTGIANTLGNKGAVAVAFQFGGTSLCFINAHLTSGNEKCSRRNQNYHDIMKALNLGHDRFSVFDLTNRFDHLFFLGDLNYRLDMDINEILTKIKKQEYSTLFTVDQLRREKELNKVFYGFGEEEIAFPPTYRYERGSRDNYAHIKIKRTGIRINVPSWCDRVLWKSYPETHNVCSAYGSSDDIMTSDHSPVFCNMQIGVRGQYVSNTRLKSTNRGASIQDGALIQFEMIEAILKAPGKTNFYLQFHSSCLSSSVRSPPNVKYDTRELSPNCVRVTWDNLPKLQPIISDREYLVDQHLLVLIKGEDDNDPHAEFVLALRSMIGTAPQKFQEHLTRKGEDAGQIQGSMHVKTRDNVSRKQKTYEFIQFGKREEVEPVLYSDSNEISRETSKPSILSNVAHKISGAAAKLPFPQKNARTPPPQQPILVQRNRSEVDSRPPMVFPPHPQSSSHIPPTLYPDTLQQRSSPSGSSSPIITNQTSPVFPSRTPPAARLSTGSITFDIPPSSTPGTLEAAIAELEAAGEMFEAEDDASKHYDIPSMMPKPLEYETLDRNFQSLDTRKPKPPPSGIAPILSSVTQYSSQSMKPQPAPRTVVGQSAPSNPKRAMADKPPSPHPRRRSVRISGNTIPVMSVQELMSRLGLSQYTEAMIANGWDTIEFLSDMLEDDLRDCGVVNSDHRREILKCIDSLGWVE